MVVAPTFFKARKLYLTSTEPAGRIESEATLP